MAVRVRFAPSPTGKLHVGSARTALFNWLFAKHERGAFVLRIEDTDQKRSNPEFLKDIYASLEFLGIRADEGPLFQSQRMALYKEHAEKLLAAGKAKTAENGGIVFDVGPQQVTFHDLLHGDITVDTTLFETLVLMKADGTPTYNFACVVDDALMKISHVIRGDDHIANTPKQVVLYRAMGFELPVFAHIPLIVGADRARLSKRFGATSVDEYKQVGYLAPAFVNYLVLLGWSPGENREKVSMDEIIQLFDIRKVKKTAAFFDQKKLDWLNSQYIKQTPLGALVMLLAERLDAKGWTEAAADRTRLTRITALIQERLRVLEDITEEHSFFFLDMPEYSEESVQKFLKQDGIPAKLKELKDRLNTLQPFEAAQVEEATRAFAAEKSLEPKALIQPVRVALTGRHVSPPLFETMAILGKDAVLRRLDHAATLASGAT
jgi:glutamyl-tRNA synthetase